MRHLSITNVWSARVVRIRIVSVNYSVDQLDLKYEVQAPWKK